MKILNARDEWPAAQFGTEKYWSESYAFWAWDEQNDLTIYAHFQRHPDKPVIWRAYATVLRGDGVYTIHSYGPQHSPFGPGFKNCEITIEKPYALWRLSVDGAAQFQTYEQQMTGCISDGPAVPLKVDVLLSLTGQHWSMPHGSTDTSKVMPAHYEQTGWISGAIELGNQEFIVECPGANDHSRGVRDTSNLRDGGFFFNAVFPSGRSLTAIKMGSEPELAQVGYIANSDGVLQQATLVVGPEATWPVVGQKDAFSIETSGLKAKLSIEPTKRRVLLTMIPPNFEHVGLKDGLSTELYYCDHTCRVQWGDEAGWGSWEMARRGGKP